VKHSPRVPFRTLPDDALLETYNYKNFNTRKRVARRRIDISALPEDALLEIFKFYVDQNRHEDAWHTLVHVCRRWRYVVFASPRRLHLELRCTKESPMKTMLDVWPALPIVINANITDSRRSGVRNLIAVLKRHDLVCRINISGVPSSLLKSGAMKKRFPMLTDLTLRSNKIDASVIPDSFLDGSAPRLRSLEFRGIPFPFPALGKLLLSATDLVTCHLWDIPNSGIISPNLIVTTLSTLTRLRLLSIGFRSPQSRADRERRHPSQLKRLVLPSLTDFFFKGDSEYLEQIVGRINTPALDKFTITFFNQLVFDTPLLRDFFSRTEVFREPHRADVTAGTNIGLTLFRLKGTVEHRMLDVTISSRVLEWQLSSLAQFCSSSFPPLLTLERLSIPGHIYQGLNHVWTDDMERSQWLEVLHPFVAVKDLVLLLQFRVASQVATALRELTGNTTTEVLPALRQVFIYHFDIGPFQEVLAPFITARQLSGHSVSVHHVPMQWSR
jgi:hypothetical protein